MTTPLLTVLIDTYNHERFIEKAIVSVLEQDFPRAETEILIVDDGSMDKTPEIVRKFVPQVRLIQKKNGGQASAFNTGIPEARGEIVAFLDGDDWWDRTKLSVISNYLDAHPNIGIVGHGIYEFDSATGNIITTIPKHTREMKFDTVEGGTFFRHMMCFFGTSRVAIRRDVLMRVLPIPESLVVEADEFMSIMSIAVSAGGLIQEPITFYRLHENNLFQIREASETKTRRIQKVLASLAEQLRIRLASVSISPAVIQAIVEPLDVDSKRLKLMLDGGRTWDTFQVERAQFRLAYNKTSVAYRMFKAIVLAFTLVLPPRTFYVLRNWYGRSNWRQWRGALGEPTARAEISNLKGPVPPAFQETAAGKDPSSLRIGSDRS